MNKQGGSNNRYGIDRYVKDQHCCCSSHSHCWCYYYLLCLLYCVCVCVCASGVFGLLCGNLFWIVICCAMGFMGNKNTLSKNRNSEQPQTNCLRLLCGCSAVALRLLCGCSAVLTAEQPQTNCLRNRNSKFHDAVDF